MPLSAARPPRHGENRRRRSECSPPDNRKAYRRLTRWFAQRARVLPWRGETDPYRVWVSEILLIQTTVAVARKRYPRFLRRFPTLRALADASVDAVLKEWEGLGYYRRARDLHQAARVIQSRYGGTFPESYDDIRALPGVGDYVAAAVSNFCFDGRYPPIDANVARVGARLFAIPGNVRSARLRLALRRHLADLMSVGGGAQWTDGLIEVGALVCAPRAPACPACPLRADCLAYHRGKLDRFGLPEARSVRKEVHVACAIIRGPDGRILIAQRPEKGLLPGLWEFPGGKREGNERLADTCRREIHEELGIDVEVRGRCLLIRHAYSHYSVRLHVFECRHASGRPRALGCRRFRWVRADQLTQFAFPSANRRIIEYARTASETA